MPKKSVLALRELGESADNIYDRYNGPMGYGKELDKSCKHIAHKYGIEKESLWRAYIGDKTKIELEYETIGRHKLKKIKLLMRILEAKTPRSSWWIAEALPGKMMRKKLEKLVGKRVIVFPRFHYILVRVPNYKWVLKWQEDMLYPFNLVQRLDGKASIRELNKRRIRSVPQYKAVAGSWERTEVKKTKLIDRKTLFKALREEVITKRVKKLIDQYGGRLGFNTHESVSSIYSGKDVYKIQYVCPKGVWNSCPCVRRKDCETLKKLLEKETNYNVKEREKAQKARRVKKEERKERKETQSSKRCKRGIREGKGKKRRPSGKVRSSNRKVGKGVADRRRGRERKGRGRGRRRR